MVYHSLLLLVLRTKTSVFPKKENEEKENAKFTADENQEIFKTLLWCQHSPCKRKKPKYLSNSNNSSLFDHSAKARLKTFAPSMSKDDNPITHHLSFSSFDSNFLKPNLNEPHINVLLPIFTELSISLLVIFHCIK